MKKILFAIIGLLLMSSELVYAQGYPVFSSSLAGGAGGVYTRRGVRRSVYRPGGYAGYTGYTGGGVVHETRSSITGTPNPATAYRVRKYVLRYTRYKVDVTKKEMEKLKPIIEHLKDGRVKSLDIVGIDKDPDLSQNRYSELVEIFRAYAPDIPISYRSISGVAVFESNDHTIEIIENY